MQSYKQCPQCGQPAMLDAPQCPRCGRVYQTTAPGPMQTQVFTSPLHGSSPLRFPIGVTAAAVVILAAAWMPWQTISSASVLPSSYTMPGMQITFTGWTGYINVSGLQLPHWIVVLAAAGVALVSWLYTLSIWRSPRSVPIGLIVYGMVHTGFAFLALILTKEAGTPGCGVFFTGLSFVGMLFAILQQFRTT